MKFKVGDEILIKAKILEYNTETNFLDSIDKFVLALKDVVCEWKDYKPEDIANEIKNRIDCWCNSDRESSEEEQSGVRDNIFEIQDVLNELYNYQIVGELDEDIKLMVKIGD